MYIHIKSILLVALSLAFLVGVGVVARGAVGGTAAASEPPHRLVVTAAPIELQAGYDRTQRFVGRVEFAQASALAFEQGGKVASLQVDEGDRVEAGAVVAALDTERLRARRVELVAARERERALRELAALRDARARYLVDDHVIAPQQADDARLEADASAAALAVVEAQIETIDVELRKAVLRAPFAGEVTARYVDIGVVVGSGTPVLRMLETAAPEVRVGVSSQLAARLRKGERAVLWIRGVAHEANVLAVLSERQRETRTIPVRLSVEPVSTVALREGDLAELAHLEPVTAAGFWLPRAALTEGARGLWAIYVAMPSDGFHHLERRPVEVLHESGERVFVRGALEPGDTVVREGVHRLVPGQLVRVASEGVSLASMPFHRRQQSSGESK